MLIIVALYFVVINLSRRLLLKLNRPESFLNRAIDTESSSGRSAYPKT